MSKFVIADDFICRAIVQRRKSFGFGNQPGQLAFARGDFLFGERNAFEALADRMFDGIGDAFAGSFGEPANQLIRFPILDERPTAASVAAR